MQQAIPNEISLEFKRNNRALDIKKRVAEGEKIADNDRRSVEQIMKEQKEYLERFPELPLVP